MRETPLPTLPCLCASLRRTSRAVSQLYEQSLRPLGLRAPQFTVLQVLSLAGEISQGQLAEMLATDSTTLTRTLAIMRRHGWIIARRGKDRRERFLRLGKLGEAKLRRALPVWEKVQSRLQARLGKPSWRKLMELSNLVTGLATAHGGSK